MILIVVGSFITDTSKREYFSLAYVGVVLFVSLLVYGWKKDQNTLKLSATRIVVSVLLFYYILLFLLGIPLGFSKTLFSTNINQWMEGLIPAFFLTIMMEYLRFLIISSNPFQKKGIYFLTFLLILCNISINANYAALLNGYGIFLFFCVTVFPIIAQETLSSYITYQFGLLPNLIYKLIINLYLYIIPIMTNLGDYLYSAFNVVIPVTLFLALNKSINFRNDTKRNNNNTRRIIEGFVTIPVFSLIAIMVVLVSGIFDYQLIAIASNSMVPVFSRGDAILCEKIKNEDDIFIRGYSCIL